WGYSGHSARSTRYSDRSRHIDRRAVLIAVIALDQSDRRAVPIAVIAPDLDSRTKLQLHHFFNTITSPAFNSSSILIKPLSRDSSSSSLSRDPHLDYSSSFPLPQITF
ncbi:hypothetical protein L249_7087, partial [Ophiocordyceps polyrhachis-furcata BCC 54312]